MAPVFISWKSTCYRSNENSTGEAAYQSPLGSIRSFLEHLNADNHRRAFDLVTSKAPSAWNN